MWPWGKHIEEETHHGQVPEDHPIFTCQICVESMLSNKNLATITIVCTIFYDAKYIETQIDNKMPNIECPIFIYNAWIACLNKN